VEENSIIWTEKYRPKKFSEVRGQEAIVSKIQSFVSQKNLPHVLFAGPPGVGKSTLALVIARELFGEHWRENFLELNSSDERGIDVVRVKVKDFARTKAMGNVPFKIIFLDECDALTKEAQQALRRTMENYTNTCRFILAANYSSKIIDPIQSRCAVFRFKPLPQEEVFAIIDKIAAQEKLILTADAKKALYDVSEGDCRRLENILQSCAAMQDNVTQEMVFSMASMAQPKEIAALLQTALAGDFVKARDSLLDTMLKYGLSGIDVIKQIQKEIWNLQLDNRAKVSLIDKCGEIEFRLVEGSDEFIQLEALLAHVSAVKK
jgi:replication factor C small subunit